MKVKAECSVNDKNELLKLANQVTYKYKYTSDNYFKIIFNKMDERIYVVDHIGLSYTNNQENELAYTGGLTRTFYITAGENTKCPYETIKELSVRLPLYNKFSENEKCKGEKYKDFKYCNKFLYSEITEEQWKKELEKYEKNLKVEIDDSSSNMWLIIGTSIGIVLLLSLVVVVIITIRKRKGRKF